MSWNFKNLNLQHVDEDRPRSLEEGDYICTISDVQIKNNGGKTSLMISLKAPSGQVINEFCKVDDSDKSDKAQRGTSIGLSRLKAILKHGGHPNPDEPGDINSLKGLTVGVRMRYPKDANGDRETWSKDGNTYQSGVKPMPFGAYYTPDYTNGHDTGTVVVVDDTNDMTSNGSGKSSGLDDEIPF